MLVPAKPGDDGGSLLWLLVGLEIGFVVLGSMTAYVLA